MADFMTSRLTFIGQQKKFWNAAAQDPDVDNKYICDLPTDACLSAIGDFEGQVLEIGCGVGRVMKPGYFGVDISEEMLGIAQERRPDCHFYPTDGIRLPFDDRVFRAVYSILVFQHLYEGDFRGYIREAHRVLDDSGKFRFQFIEGSENEPWSHHYSLEKVQGWLEEVGFDIKKVERGLVHFQWTWVLAVKK